MRTYQRSIGALQTPGARYQELMLSAMPMNQLYQLYRMPLYMVIYDDYYNAEYAIDMYKIKDDCERRSITFDQYLTATNNVPLPYEDEIPSLTTTYAHYADAFYAGYTINREHPEGYHNPVIARDEKTWAKMTKDSVDYIGLYKTSLITVNGFFHATDADSSGLYVLDAFKSLAVSGESGVNMNSIGITNFTEVAELEFRKFITDIEVLNDEDTLLNGATLNFKEDITNKVVLFVIGGYLFYNHPAFIRNSPNGYRVRFDLLDLPNRYYEMRDYIDVSSLDVEFDKNNPSMTLQSRLTSDDYITKLLSLTQSFVVLLEAEHIFHEELPLQFDKRSPWAETKMIPDMPLITYNGRLLDYHWKYGWDDSYLVLVSHHLVLRNVVNTTSNKHLAMDNSLDANNPIPVGKPMFLYMGKDI